MYGKNYAVERVEIGHGGFARKVGKTTFLR